MKVEVKRISDKYSDIQLPKYETSGSAGMDIAAAIDEVIIIKAGEVALIPTNLSMELSILPSNPKPVQDDFSCPYA